MKLCRLIILSVMLFLFGLTAPAYAKITVTVAHTHVETHPQHKAFLVLKTILKMNLVSAMKSRFIQTVLPGQTSRYFPWLK